ncbi:hypothetical protein PG991_007078 [Apiospora marii]|uniref:Uncharacterized protein n=1 Tax=Apiospora marii TaxID=335849 RepID=A0ABR1S0D7_9PEZI
MSRPSLLALPGELQNQIFLRHCDGVDRLLLRLTGARLRQKMPPPTGQELLAAESLNLFVIEKDLFTCPACASLQRRTNFDDDVTIQRKARGGYDVADRFCLACGVKEYTVVLEDGTTQTTTRYTPGTRIMVAFVSHVLCPGCRGFCEAGGATLCRDRGPGASGVGLRYVKTHYCAACLSGVLRTRPNARYSLAPSQPSGQ